MGTKRITRLTPEQTEWRAISSHPGYEVSESGDVRSRLPWRGTPVPRVVSQVVRPDGRFEVALHTPRPRLRRKVHQLVAEAFIGPRPEGQQTRHLDGNHQNNRLSNLAYGTPSQNRQDQMQHGTHHQVLKTECPKGHPYNEANTHINSNGHRICKACRTISNRSRAVEKREMQDA